MHSALSKATGQLLEDLHRNVRLLGTPERSVSPPLFTPPTPSKPCWCNSSAVSHICAALNDIDETVHVKLRHI